MKTRTRKTTRVLCASAIAMMTLLSSAAPAFAVNAGPTEDEAQKVKLGVDNNSITFDKKIYADEGENVPYVTIEYRLSPRTVTDDKEKAAFAANGYDNVVAGKGGLTASATTFTNNSLVQGQNYFEETSTIKASALVDGLTQPTVFTYTLEELVPEKAQGFITTDTDKGTTRKLNIYVGYKNDDAEKAGTLSVLYATLAQENGTKAVGFENNYDTQAIHLTKKVTGNQGDKTKKFTFTVNIANQYSKVTASGTTTSLDNTKLTPNDNHNVSFTVDLANDETLDLTGLSKGATYTVSEDKGTYDSSATVDGKEAAVTDHAISGDDDTVVFTNTKEGKIPTGIYLNHKLPFNIAGIAILGGAISLVAKKRHDALEEDDDE